MDKFYKELDILSVYMDYFVFNNSSSISFDKFKGLIYYDSTKMYESLEIGDKIPFYLYWNKIRNLKIVI